MSESHKTISHISLPRGSRVSIHRAEQPIKCMDMPEKRSLSNFQLTALHSKSFGLLIAFTFALNGCSSLSLFQTNASHHDEAMYSLSDVERSPTSLHDRVEVTSLSPSIVDKNIAISAHTPLPEQPTQVEIEALKSKSDTQASLSTSTEPTKPSAPPPPPPVALSRSTLTGKWAIREAGGSGCKVVLSSAPALDLYKASTSGCSGPDIRTVNSWDFRNGEVYLYARGTVVARFKGGGSSLQGALSKSGAPLVLSR